MLTEAPKIDPRYILAHDIHPPFMEAFINAPSHLIPPARHRHAFLSGVMRIDPAKERIVVREREEHVILDEGVERPLTEDEVQKFIKAAVRISKGKVKVLSVDDAIHVVTSELQRMDVVSLDAPVNEDEDSSLGSFLVDETDQGADTVDKVFKEDILIALFSCLSPREIEILRMRHGVDVDHPMTLQEIGDIKGLTRERIRQIEAKALKKLRKPANIKKLEGYFYHD